MSVSTEISELFKEANNRRQRRPNVMQTPPSKTKDWQKRAQKNTKNVYVGSFRLKK